MSSGAQCLASRSDSRDSCWEWRSIWRETAGTPKTWSRHVWRKRCVVLGRWWKSCWGLNCYSCARKKWNAQKTCSWTASKHPWEQVKFHKEAGNEKVALDSECIIFRENNKKKYSKLRWMTKSNRGGEVHDVRMQQREEEVLADVEEGTFDHIMQHLSGRF